MVGKTDNQAPCQSSELWSQDKNWDITPELSTNERKALADYARCLALGKKGYHTVQVRRELTRLIIPLKTALKWMNEPYRVCRRVNILRDYPDDKTKLYPRN